MANSSASIPSTNLLALVYDPLPNPNCIRLLQKCGKTSEGTLCCSLAIHCLDDKTTAYYCLSYTWGNPFAHGNHFSEHFESVRAQYEPSSKVPILVQGQLIYIQKNLYDALDSLDDAILARESGRRVPNGNHSGLFWADAICINQDDVEEKSAQVSRMDQIYSRASFVVAWLGPMDTHAELGIKALNSLSTHIEDFQQSQIEPYGGSKEKYEEAGVPFISREEWVGLASIFQRQWFRRVWIVQEAVLPQALILQIGNQFLSCASVGRVAEALRQKEAELGTARSRDFVPENDVAVAVEWNTAEIYKWQKNMSLAKGKSKTHDDFFSLDHLVVCFWTFLASDPRDKIFALYGLLNTFKKNKFKADYRYTLPNVYTNATRHIIAETRNLEILSSCIYSEKRRADLPSWVPDFSLSGINPIPNIFDADKGLEFQFPKQDGDDSPILIVQGHYVGKVAQAGGRVDTRSFGMFRFDPSWLRLVLSLRNAFDDAKSQATSLSETLWRTLCMNMSPGSLFDSNKFGAKAPDDYATQFSTLMMLFILAGADEQILENINNTSPKNGATIVNEPCNPFDGKMATVLDDLDALAKHDGNRCWTPYRHEVLSLWNDLKYTLVRITGAGADGWPEDFYVPKEVLEGHARCVGRGFVKQDSRIFAHCLGFGRAFAMVYGGRQLITVDDKHLGMAPLSAQADDEVWVFPGLKSLAVLRDIRSSEVENNPTIPGISTPSSDDSILRRQLVGTCYVHGLMNGEAVSTNGSTLLDIQLE